MGVVTASTGQCDRHGDHCPLRVAACFLDAACTPTLRGNWPGLRAREPSAPKSAFCTMSCRFQESPEPPPPSLKVTQVTVVPMHPPDGRRFSTSTFTGSTWGPCPSGDLTRHVCRGADDALLTDSYVMLNIRETYHSPAGRYALGAGRGVDRARATQPAGGQGRLGNLPSNTAPRCPASKVGSCLKRHLIL